MKFELTCLVRTGLRLLVSSVWLVETLVAIEVVHPLSSSFAVARSFPRLASGCLFRLLEIKFGRPFLYLLLMGCQGCDRVQTLVGLLTSKVTSSWVRVSKLKHIDASHN